MLNYAYKYICAVPVQTSDPHTSDSTNLRHTNVEQYKHQTRTNVGIVQTWDWCKRWTSTNTGPVQMSNRYKRRTKENKYFFYGLV